MPSTSIWTQSSQTPPRGPCTHRREGVFVRTCACLRFMQHPARATSTFECDGCGHHACFHAMVTTEQTTLPSTSSITVAEAGAEVETQPDTMIAARKTGSSARTAASVTASDSLKTGNETRQQQQQKRALTTRGGNERRIIYLSNSDTSEEDDTTPTTNPKKRRLLSTAQPITNLLPTMPAPRNRRITNNNTKANS
ncbi:MAG: hypothetical protein M1836_002817 [Candelina mexicana]|nr:MAG: hypothetical protein M1836_002817 [Candelina mexicana]